MDEPQLQDRVAALEARVQLLEDRLAIQRLISSWGPAVDTGNSEAAASLFTEDCVLESDLSYLVTPAAISAMVRGEGHQALIHDGSAHVPTTAIVDVDGDTATATGYTRVYRHTPDGYEVWRVSANTWDLRRTEDGWRVVRRTAQVIDDTGKANALLSRVFSDE
ncbi:MAG TPA: nuclear transport factor 2 family protein [Acidimicrobiia bacterium]